MKKGAAAPDQRQPMLFDDAPPLPPQASDERARADMAAIVETLAGARTHPWSARLLGWQLRSFDTLAQLLTPVDAASLRARLDAELDRLGPAEE